MSGYTPGPWHVINQWERPNSAVATIEPGPDTMEGPNYWTVAHANTLRPEHQANARLIAAAPELYDAAEMALNTLLACCVSAGGVDDRKTILEAQAMLRAALTKAGEQQ